MRIRVFRIFAIITMCITGANATVHRTMNMSKMSQLPTMSDILQSGHVQPVSQIPTTKYVADYLRGYCGNPDIDLQNISDKKIPSEKYLMSAIDKINGATDDVDFAPGAAMNAPITMSYLVGATEKLTHHDNCCYFPWNKGAEKVSIQTQSIAFGDETLGAGYGYFWYASAYGDGKYVGLAYGSNIATYSTDGINWNFVKLPVSGNWYSMAYGNGVFVAIAFNTAPASIYSYDGITWYESSSFPGARSWQNIVFGDGKFIAVAWYTNFAAYSEDGVNWETYTIPNAGTNAWAGVTWGNGAFVAVLQAHRTAAVSPDGKQWDIFSTNNGGYFWDMAYGNGRFVTTAMNSNALIWSEDGKTWNSTTKPESASWLLDFANNKFIATSVGKSYIFVSDDGVNWTKQEFAPGSRLSSSISSEDKTVIFGQKNYYSTDSQNWNAVVGVGGDTYGLVYGDGRFISGSYSTAITYLDNGSDWTFSSVDEISAHWLGLAYGNNRFVATGYGANVAIYSDNGGETWTQTSLPVSGYWYTAAFGNNVYASLPWGGDTVVYSYDGINWKSNTLPMSADYLSMTYGNNRFIGVAMDTNKIITSFDGVNWNDNFELPDVPNWAAITYGDGKFVAVASGGDVAAYSYDGETWYQTQLPAVSSWYSVAYGDGLFVVTTDSDNILAISSDGILWDVYTDEHLTPTTFITYGENRFLVAHPNYNGITVLDTVKSENRVWAIGEMCSPVDTDVATMCENVFVGGTAQCISAKCNCTRVYKQSDNLLTTNIGSTITLPIKYSTTAQCNSDCANACMENVINNANGVQSELLCRAPTTPKLRTTRMGNSKQSNLSMRRRPMYPPEMYSDVAISE